MPAEQRCHTCAAPRCARESLQCQKEQDRVRRGEQQVGQVMARWMKAVNLAIENVRQPSERMPVARVEAEGPYDSLPGKPRLHVRIFRHVLLIVIKQELMAKRGQ